jgi:hypothetical protein
MVQDAADNGVHDLFNCFWMRIEEGIGRKDGGPGQQQQFKVLYLDEVQWGLARHQDELPLFFQNHIGGAQQHVLAVTMSDPANGPHRARYHHHGVRRVRPTGKRRVHALKTMGSDALAQLQSIRQLLGNDGMGVVAQHDVNFVFSRINVVEQALSVQRATGPGNRDQKFQIGIACIFVPAECSLVATNWMAKEDLPSAWTQRLQDSIRQPLNWSNSRT